MYDKKEKQDSLVPVNKHVVTRFEGFLERTTESGIVVPESVLDVNVTMKDEKLYNVSILRKADDCSEVIPETGFALINQLSGFGIPTIEPGYIKVVHENSILMTSTDKRFSVKSIVPGMGRALVEITSKKKETESGILIPEDATTNVRYDAATLGGTVVSVSPDIKWLKEGDKIRFDSYMGTEIFIEGKEYRLVLENEVIARITN